MTCPNGAKDSSVASTARSFTTLAGSSPCVRSICAGWAALARTAAMRVFSPVALRGRGGAGAEGEAAAVRQQRQTWSHGGGWTRGPGPAPASRVFLVAEAVIFVMIFLIELSFCKD